MDASCKIQRSIHDVRLTYKYVSRILGTYHLAAIIFIMNDTWLYTTPIAKLTKVETTREVEGKSTRGTAEKKYSQKMQGIILNGEKREKQCIFPMSIHIQKC